MKRKIVIGLSIYAVVFLLAGVYVIRTIRSATASLDRLITLHQVEILREHYLLEIKRVQSDLLLEYTQYSRNFDTVVKHAMGMGRFIETCFECHHSPRGTERLNGLETANGQVQRRPEQGVDDSGEFPQARRGEGRRLPDRRRSDQAGRGNDRLHHPQAWGNHKDGVE